MNGKTSSAMCPSCQKPMDEETATVVKADSPWAKVPKVWADCPCGKRHGYTGAHRPFSMYGPSRQTCPTTKRQITITDPDGITDAAYMEGRP